MTTVLRLESPTMISPTRTMWRPLLCVLVPLFMLFAFDARAQTNSATYSSQSVQLAMLTSSTQTVTVTMANNGTTTWTSAGQYFLGSQNLENNLTWGVNRVPVPTSIAPGGQASFSFPITAPSTPGTYNFQWRVVQDGVAWFGPYTPNVQIVVSAPVNGSQLIGTSVTSPMVQGTTYGISVTMKNTGNTTWPAGGAYRLGSTNPQNTLLWGVNRVTPTVAVAPQQQHTFSFNVVAPAAGDYTMGWGMVQEDVAWFGQTSSSAVRVNPPVQAPTITVSRTPSPMTAGQSYTLNWSSTNATSISRICTSTGTGYTVNDAPALNGPSTGTASSAWVGYPSSCAWKATGAGGATATFNETMTTNAAPVSDVVTYIHTDGLGSPAARTNTSGGLVSRTRYEPYGLTASGAVPTLGFTGHVNDADTGLVYMQQRYYAPVAGRFLSIDPVVTDANTGSSFNRYTYANNSPYKYVDPDGRNVALAACIGGPIACGVAVIVTAYVVHKIASGPISTNTTLNSGSGDVPSSNGGGARNIFGSNTATPPPEDDHNQRRDVGRDNNRKTEGKDQPASDRTGKDMGRKIEKDLGKDARKDFHDMKEKGAPDRTEVQLKQDAADLYREAGKEPPKWTQ